MNQKKIHNRKTIRLKGYDYSQQGLYFITICTHNRECLFGEISNNSMILNDAGKIANQCWLQIPNHFPNIKLHQHIIMPNHIHGIIEITSPNNIVGANNHSPYNIDSKNRSNIDVSNMSNNHSPYNNIDAPNMSNNHLPNRSNIDVPNRANIDVPNRANIDSPNRSNIDSPNRANIDSPLRSPSKTVGSMVRGYKIGVTKWFRENMGNKFPVGKSAWQRNYWEHIIRDEKSYNNISQYIINNPANWKKDKLHH